MRRLVERGLPELVVAGAARHPHVAHAPAALGSLPGRRADTGFPADLRQARPQRVTERAMLWLVFENRHRHGMIMPARRLPRLRPWWAAIRSPKASTTVRSVKKSCAPAWRCRGTRKLRRRTPRRPSFRVKRISIIPNGQWYHGLGPCVSSGRSRSDDLRLAGLVGPL